MNGWGSGINPTSLGSITYDGAHIWAWETYPNTALVEVDPATCNPLGSYSVLAGFYTNGFGAAMVFDGTYLWLTGPNGLFKISTSGVVLGQYPTGGTSPTGMAFDGTYIWVANAQSGNVGKVHAVDGSLVAVYNTGAQPMGVAFDGTNIWVSNQLPTGSLTKLLAQNGSNLGTFAVSSSGYSSVVPSGLAFDGANTWVVGSMLQYASNVLVAWKF